MVIARIGGNLYFFKTLGEFDRYLAEYELTVEAIIYFSRERELITLDKSEWWG